MKGGCINTFLYQESYIFVLEEVSRLMKIGSRKILGIPLLWIVVIVSLTIAATASAIIISNILGPYSIHVTPQSGQLLTISASKTPPSQVSLGSTVEIDITVSNPTSSSVTGYLIVNITATDFTPSSSDISISMRSGSFGGWSGTFSFTPTSIPGGFMYKSENQFTWASGCSDAAAILITFNKANPTDSGNYEVTIGITSN